MRYERKVSTRIGGHQWLTKNSELRAVRQSRDGRRRYDETGKRALVEAALRPGVSVARLAQEHGINANLLRKWITKYLVERESAASSSTSQDDGAVESDPRAIEMIDGVAIDIPDKPMCHPPVKALKPPFVPAVPARSTPSVVSPAPSLNVPSM